MKENRGKIRQQTLVFQNHSDTIPEQHNRKAQN